ncbi:transposase [Ochrobactrum sp. CM-21-5]|nr:transposase [Ochrobactrum sp. CM-21-5]
MSCIAEIYQWHHLCDQEWLRWRDGPKDYGPHKTIYNRFIRWSRLGVFNRIFAELAAKGREPDQRMIMLPILKPIAPQPAC